MAHPGPRLGNASALMIADWRNRNRLVNPLSKIRSLALPLRFALPFGPVTGDFASELARLLMPNLLADWHGRVTEFARLLV